MSSALGCAPMWSERFTPCSVDLRILGTVTTRARLRALGLESQRRE